MYVPVCSRYLVSATSYSFIPFPLKLYGGGGGGGGVGGGHKFPMEFAC